MTAKACQALDANDNIKQVPLWDLDEVGGQRGAVCFFRPLKDFSDGFMKTVLLQPPLPEPCRLLSQHTALQRGDSTGIGLLRHPPHPLGSVHLLLWPFTVS